MTQPTCKTCRWSMMGVQGDPYLHGAVGHLHEDVPILPRRVFRGPRVPVQYRDNQVDQLPGADARLILEGAWTSS